MNYLLFLKVYLFIAKMLAIDALKEVKSFFEEININQYNFSKEEKKRIQTYIQLSLYIKNCVEILENKKYSNSEVKRFVYTGAITPILDDFTDVNYIKSDEFIQKLDNDFTNEINRLELCKILWHKVFKPNEKSILKELVIKSALAQDKSIIQVQKEKLTIKELIEVTKLKSGYSTLVFWSLNKNDVSNAEKSAIKTLGYVIQLINDMFDIYKDLNNNQQTIFTNSKNLREELKEFYSAVDTFIFEFANLQYCNKKLLKCFAELSLLLSLGFVCAKQLSALQKTTKSDMLDLKRLERKLLICDMEKPSNMLATYLMSVKLYNRFEKILLKGE